MSEWLGRIVGAGNVPVVFWLAAACIALLVLYLLYLLLKRMRSGTYVAGGRNRKARLAVMDATAIDTHRRLVLVRRDDVEHLLLIGGHSDIVVESHISLHGPAKRQLVGPDTTHAQQPAPAAVQLARGEPPVASKPAHHAPPAPQMRQPLAAPRPAAQIQAAPVHPRPVATPAPPPRSRDELDSDLLKELESALDIDEAAPQPARTKSSLDEEMAKLLGELSSHKR